jgi:hypothetical protein
MVSKKQRMSAKHAPSLPEAKARRRGWAWYIRRGDVAELHCHVRVYKHRKRTIPVVAPAHIRLGAWRPVSRLRNFNQSTEL